MDKDVQDLFKVKNREILITNLKFDLDKNIDSLLETINNIFSLEFETAIKKNIAVLSDAGDNSSDKVITDTINSMKEINYTDIESIIAEKKELLVGSIDNLEFTEDGMNNYYEVVFDSTKTLKESIKNSFDSIIKKKYKKIEDYINKHINEDNKELTLIRVKDYIDNRLYGKLETKIHMEIMLRDNNLINKAKEVYARYQDICSKTE